MRGLSIGTHQEWRKAEALIGWGSIVYGFWLALPFATLTSVVTYKYLISLGVPEIVWGLFFAATGVLRLYAVNSKRHNLRRASALVDVWKWLLFWILLVVAAPDAAFPVFILVFAVASALSYLSGSHCEVVDGQCNGTLEHKIASLASSYQSWGEDS